MNRVVIIIGNYPADEQRSMDGFARLLKDVLSAQGVKCELTVPRVRLGRMVRGRRGLAKWVGYIDKFILFSAEVWARYWLRRLMGAEVRVHIADHSNSMYAMVLPSSATVVTCHDMLAVRAGLGEEGTACRASPTGRLFQRLIKRGLGRAGRVACVSRATLADFERIVRPKPGVSSLIHNALNAPFAPQDTVAVRAAVGVRLPFEPAANYLFHVGSSLPRKNRVTIVRAFAAMRVRGWDGWLVFAGAGEADDIRGEIDRLGVRERVACLGGVTHSELNALYAGALAFIFPSLSEGFGWPPVEANACGCPVISSNTTSLPEVCGDGAQLFDPFDVEGIVGAALALTDPVTRATWVERGSKNAARFDREAMAKAYLRLY